MTANEPQRIEVEEVRRKLQSGSPTLLVCAYPMAMYRNANLEGSISREDFEKRLPTLARDHEIVFY